MGLVKSYASDLVVVIVGGVPMTGFTDGTFVEIEQMSDGTSSQSGGDGEIARSRSADKRHKVTITLQSTSDGNDVLDSLYTVDQITLNGLFPILVEDLSGRTVFAAGQAWVDKRPNASLSKAVEPRAWVITTGEPEYALKGN